MIPPIFQISDIRQLPRAELFARIDRGGPRLAVQLRDPELSARELFFLGRELRDRTRRVGARLLVNDRLDLALLLEADGLHLGRHGLEVVDARGALGDGAIITCSAHDDDELARAAGADAVVVSPIFASPGKGAPRGLEAIERTRRLAPRLAVIALGGITPDNAASCFSAGAAAVAAIRHDLTSMCP